MGQTGEIEVSRRAAMGSAALAIALGLGPSGCRSPRISRLPTGTGPGGLGLGPGDRRPPPTYDDQGFALLERRTASGASPSDCLRLASLAERLALGAEGSSRPEALARSRDAAAYSWFAAERIAAGGGGASGLAEARALHNRAVEACLRHSGAADEEPDPAWPIRLRAAGIEPASVPPWWRGLAFRGLWIAEDYRVTGLDPVSWDGWGVPLIAARDRQPRPDDGPDRFLPGRLRLASTAVLRPSGRPEGGAWRASPVALELHDPSAEEAIPIGGAPGPLAADLTSPLALQFLQADLARAGRLGLVNPEGLADETGLYLLRPYEPGKIPVLLAHGLRSSPQAWLRVVDLLQADPVIRQHYQFCLAFYSTGYPILYSAMLIRRELELARLAFNPRGADPAFDRMVVVGHSMGGLMAKLLVQDSGRELIDAMFTRPIDRVSLSPPTRVMMEELLIYRAVPSIRRAVFLATPHRGSHLANRLLGRVTTALVRRDGELYDAHQEILARNGPSALRPPLDRRAPSSVDNLEWDSPLLRVMSRRGIAPGVPYHSVVGVINPAPSTSTRRATDGVVAYESAHLDGAESELVVRRTHFMTNAPEVIAEVRRILRRHLDDPASLPPAGFGPPAPIPGAPEGPGLADDVARWRPASRELRHDGRGPRSWPR